MRWPVVVLCGLAGCGWLAGIHDYTRADDGGGPGDGATEPDATAGDCSTGLGSGSQCATSLSAGVGATCAIANGVLYCWGQSPPNAASSTPHAAVAIDLGAAVPTSVQLSSSADAASTFGVGCYLSNSALWCWGDSYWGQAQAVQADAPSPDFQQPTNVVTYAVGGDHVCATMGGASDIACWGRSDEDELDDNDANDEPACTNPILGGKCSDSPILTSVVTGGLLVAGAAHTCVSPTESGLMPAIGCWGDNAQGQLGGDIISSSDDLEAVLDPTQTPFTHPATELALGASHTCAIVEGLTYCWGANDMGQLGTLTMSTSNYAVEIAPEMKFVHIAAGGDTTCAIDDSKNVWCWGSNVQGTAGQGPGNTSTPPGFVDTPTRLTAITDATAIAVGATHACAELADGDIVCWGDNGTGELGDDMVDHGHGPLCTLARDCEWNPVTVVKQP